VARRERELALLDLGLDEVVAGSSAGGGSAAALKRTAEGVALARMFGGEKILLFRFYWMCG